MGSHGSIRAIEITVESLPIHRIAISVDSKSRSGSNDVLEERGVQCWNREHNVGACMHVE